VGEVLQSACLYVCLLGYLESQMSFFTKFLPHSAMLAWYTGMHWPCDYLSISLSQICPSVDDTHGIACLLCDS